MKKIILINFLFCLIFLEFFSFVGTKLNFFFINEIPNIYRDKNYIDHSLWRNEKNSWGAWHANNKKTYHSGRCFSAEYKSNEIGARDNSFLNILNKKNYLLLGDSFAEGWGVNKNDTAERILEDRLNINILNFASAMDFGPVQYFLIYDQLAKKYQHDGIFIFFLPQNDFVDNDYETFIKKSNKEIFRYRPYYKEITNNNFTIFYPPSARKKDSFNEFRNQGKGLRSFIKKYFYFNNFLITISAIKYSYTNKKEVSGVKNNIESWYSGYYDSKLDQQKAAIFFLEKILKASNEKKVFFVIIPTLADYYRNKKENDSYKNYYWYKKLIKFKESNKNFYFLDLLNAKIDNPEKLFLWCDGHWSILGNSFFAEYIENNFKNY